MSLRQRGFSLVEMLVTLGLLGFLLMIGLPMSSAWSDGAKQQTTASLLREGIGRAKAQALRNPGGVVNADEPAAVLCQLDQTLVVQRIDRPSSGKASVNCSATGSVIWSAGLPGTAGVKLADDSAFTCTAFNNRGMPITSGTGCSVLDINVTVATQDAINVPII